MNYSDYRAIRQLLQAEGWPDPADRDAIMAVYRSRSFQMEKESRELQNAVFALADELLEAVYFKRRKNAIIIYGAVVLAVIYASLIIPQIMVAR